MRTLSSCVSLGKKKKSPQEAAGQRHRISMHSISNNMLHIVLFANRNDGIVFNLLFCALTARGATKHTKTNNKGQICIEGANGISFTREREKQRQSNLKTHHYSIPIPLIEQGWKISSKRRQAPGRRRYKITRAVCLGTHIK